MCQNRGKGADGKSSRCLNYEGAESEGTTPLNLEGPGAAA